MLMPKKTKYRKTHRGTLRGKSKGARELFFGDYGLQAIEPRWLTAQQIESMRVTIARNLKKVGKLFLRVFPDKPVTKKPAETRMGKGKGNPEIWVFPVRSERIICELSELPEQTARDILKSAAYKLPMRTRFVKKKSESL